MKGARQFDATSIPSSSRSSRMSAASGVSPGIDLAAGEFPEPGHRLAFRTLSQQDAAVGIDQRHGDDEDDGLAGSGPASGRR